MVWFQCEDCGENLKKRKLSWHFSMCSATKLYCMDCGNMFGQDSAHYHNRCITEVEKYRPKGQSYGNNSKQQQLEFDPNAEFSNSTSWFCSLCNANMTCEQDYFAHAYGKRHQEKAKEVANKQKQQSEQPKIDKDNSKEQPNFDITLGLSNHYPWFCSLCNTKATSQHTLLSHANGKKHRANVKWFDAEQQQRQSKHSTIDRKDTSKQQIEVDTSVGLSNCHPWFCSLCNTKATSQQSLLSHGNGRKHQENVEFFNAKQQQQSEKSTVDKKDTIENASDGYFERKKVYIPFSSAVANGYSQADKKRKLETFDKTWNADVVQAEEAEGRGEKKNESKKANEQDNERKGKKDKKQTNSDSDFEYDKEDIKQLLVAYSKEEIVNLIYKTAEKGSRLISAILESADRDIAQRNIFVCGLGWDTTHENFQGAFESYGEIEDCSVVKDNDTGRCKGYGFVLFKTRIGAREALRNPEKRLYNRTVVCNLASKKPSGDGKVQDMVEQVKINLTQMANKCEVTFPGLELPHQHVLENRHQQQQTMDMYRQNIPFCGNSQLPDFDPMYGALSGNQMVAGLPNYCMFGSGMVNQGLMLPPNHMGMAGQYFGDGNHHAWYQR